MWNETLEDLIVVKRSGQRVEFNASKVAIAIKKAFDATYEKQIFKIFEKVLNYINDNYKDRKTINVEDIQDIIESILKVNCDEVYYCYKNYREKRAASRKAFSEKQQHKFVKAIEKVVDGANKGDGLNPPGILNTFGRVISLEYAKNYILDNKYLKASEEGNIFIHNLDYVSLGYLSYLDLKIDLNEEDSCLDNFISNIIASSNEISNEILIENIDVLLEKHFLDKYKFYLKKYLKRYLKAFGIIDFISPKKYYETINRINNIEESSIILKEYMINNTLQNIFLSTIDDATNDTYVYIKDSIEKLFNVLSQNKKDKCIYTISISDTKRKICQNIRKDIIEFLNNHQLLDIHIIFKIDINNDDELNKVISLIIYQKNISISFDEKAEYFSNAVRLYENINGDDGTCGRMVVAGTSINMARLGLKCSDKSLKIFYEKFDNILDLVKNELIMTFENLGNKGRENYRKLFRGNIQGDERLEDNQKIRKIIKSGTLSIGLVGLKECVIILENDEEKQLSLLIDILKYASKKCQEYTDETKLNFNIFEPNDEKSRKGLISIDKAIYGIKKNITDKDMYELIDTAKFIKDYKDYAKIQKYFKGGCLIRFNIRDNMTNKKIMDLIKEIKANDINYIHIGKTIK